MSARDGAASVTDKHGRPVEYVKFDPIGWAPNMQWALVRDGKELYRGPEWACKLKRIACENARIWP